MVRGDAVLVSEDAPRLHDSRIKGHLRARLVGERRRKGEPVLAAERLARLLCVVQVAVPAVPVLGELFQQVVVVVPEPDADGDQTQRVQAVGLGGRVEDPERVRHVDVRDAVRHQDDVVEGFRTLAAGRVREPDAEVEPGLHVGGLVRVQAGDGRHDVLVVRGGVLNGVGVDDTRGEVHDGDAVAFAQALADGLGRLTCDGDPVAAGHRTRCVEHERHIEGRVIGKLRGLEGDAHEVQVGFERMGGGGGCDAVGAAVVGEGVVVVEGVHPLLGPHRVRLHVVVVLGPRQREEVRRAVNVEAEGRYRVHRRCDEGQAAVVPERRVLGLRPLDFPEQFGGAASALAGRSTDSHHGAPALGVHLPLFTAGGLARRAGFAGVFLSRRRRLPGGGRFRRLDLTCRVRGRPLLVPLTGSQSRGRSVAAGVVAGAAVGDNRQCEQRSGRASNQDPGHPLRDLHVSLLLSRGERVPAAPHRAEPAVGACVRCRSWPDCREESPELPRPFSPNFENCWRWSQGQQFGS